MGLLDDAIREHLELKRRAGADPSEVALQERAALDPVYSAQDAATEGPEELEAAQPGALPPDVAGGDEEDLAALELREDAAGEGPVDFETAGAAPPGAEAIAADDAPPHGDPVVGSRGTLSEETAEIDMRAVLASEDEHEGPQGDELGAEALGAEADDADWDFPGGHPEDPPPEPIPGQERLSFE